MVISRRACDNSRIDEHAKGSSSGSHTLDLLDRDTSFAPGRSAGLSRLAEFLPRAGRDYQTYRNYDYGPGRHFNVSRLSPYLSTRLIREVEVLEATLKQYSKQEAYKFVQEIFWRGYWKGWLEQRPQLWKSYWEVLPSSLEQLNEDPQAKKNYLAACLGETGIKIYDSWVRELVETGYLHNHARMWFASIWIFTLNLPWQLGAELFMKYLFDGDSASNTLGWRWVAGIQTKGKNYVASEWNIKKFTNNRFSNIKLNENPFPIMDDRNYSIVNNNFLNINLSGDQRLLIFENNLSFDQTDFKDQSFKNIYFIYNGNETRQIKLDEKVLTFKKSLIEDQIKNLKNKSINCEIINIQDLKNMKENLLALYPSIGENLDFLNENNLKNINFLYRKIDQYSWKYCNKGFFNFKSYIPKIVQEFI